MQSARFVSTIASVRTFATSAVRLSSFQRPLTGYAMFLKSTKTNPALNALPIAKRGKETGRMWNSLSAAEKAAFVAKGQNTLVTVTRKEKKARKTREPSALNLFYKANYSKVANLPLTKRFGALAKLWNARK
jgi:hypothetical protein